MAEEYQYNWTDNPTASGVAKCDTDVLNDCLMHLKYDKIDGGGSSFNLFDTKLSDHILTYKESKGWALQGTYVYKEAVAGSRYGYPDFYAKCLEEYNEAIDVEEYFKSNITKVGYISDNKGLLSNFSTTSRAIMPDAFSPNSDPWEMQFKFTTGTVTTRQQILAGADVSVAGVEFGIEASSKFIWWLSSKGATSDIVSAGVGTYQVLADTTYWVKVAWDGANYTLSYSLDGEEFITDITKTSTTPIISGVSQALGMDTFENANVWSGSIDLTESYINISGKRWWTGTENYSYKKHANGHRYYDIANKSVIDTYYNTNGTAWYYGIDTENERVFLPRNDYFEQVTGTTSEVGKGVEAGLPNITGRAGGALSGVESTYQGAFYYGGNYSDSAAAGGGSTDSYALFDASLSNPIYGNSDTVQPPAVKKLLYICVGNTTSESTITDVVDVTTTENDTMPLFTGQYFDFKPNNPSWLKAGEQVNSGSIYATAYNELVNELTNPKYGLKVIETSTMQSDVDYSEYWKVNQEEMWFRTPTKLSYKALNGGVKGNGITLGLTNGTQNASLREAGNSTLGARLEIYGKTLPYVNNSGTNIVEYSALGITSDSSKSGIIAEEANSQLYFKVANAVENLELLNVGEVLEALADKISRQDCKAYIVETYVNGTSGYNVYSNRYCEQWGTLSQTSSGTTTQTIEFVKAFVDTNYGFYTSADAKTFTLTTTSCTASYAWGNGGSAYGTIFWIAKGYIA